MKKEGFWPMVTFFAFYTGLLFGGWAWMINNQTKQITAELKAEITTTIKNEITPIKAEITTIKAEITTIKAEITTIKSALTNHITDTNKKIESLTNRFNRLYELLLKDKNQNTKS